MKLKNWVYSFLEIKYGIGFFEGNTISDYSYDKVKWLRLGKYNQGWFADPFILTKDGDTLQVLVEEWVYSQKKGRLALLDINVKGGEYYLQSVTPILTLDTHLSFPIPYFLNGKTYVCPENSESNKLILYEFDEKSRKLVNPMTLIEAPLVDTQIVKIGDEFFAFGVNLITGKLTDAKSLQIYKSPSLFGPYTLSQTIQNQKAIERGAGLIFKDGEKYIRPAQDCDGGYGIGLILYELTFLDIVYEKQICHIGCQPSKYMGQALHTINSLNNTYVVDGRDYRFCFGRIVNCIIQIVKRLIR